MSAIILADAAARLSDFLSYDPSFDPSRVSVGACPGACGGTCGTCAPSPRHEPVAPGVPIMSTQPVVVASDFQIPDAARYDPDVARRCLSPLMSEPTEVPAGETVTVPVQPSMGCFVGMWRKIIAVDTSDPQLRQRVLVGRSFIGDCPVACRNALAYSDFFESDECLGCPIPTVEVGKTALNENLHVEVMNPNAAGSVTVQVGLWGICYPKAGCCRWRG